MARARSRSARLAAALGLGALLSAAGACVLAEPTGELPTPTPTRPNIVRGSAVPSPSRVLGTFPDKLVVPVELSDPTATFEWSAFIDYNPLTGEGLVDVRQSVFEPSTLDDHVRTIEIPLPAPPDLGRCHTIEVVVALKLLTTTDPKNAHTPAEPGGDSLTWFYSPGGDLSGCPVLDAGILDAAAADGGEGGAAR